MADVNPTSSIMVLNANELNIPGRVQQKILMSFFPAKARTKINKHGFDVNNTTTTLSELVFMEYNPK